MVIGTEGEIEPAVLGLAYSHFPAVNRPSVDVLVRRLLHIQDDTVG